MSARVLILEDDSGVATLIERALLRAGFHPDVYLDIEQAQKRLKDASDIEVVVLDYKLSPQTTGIDFFKVVKEEGWLGSALLITGFLEEKVILEALRAGFHDIFPKTPDFMEHLVAAVQRVVTFRRQEEELGVLRKVQELNKRLQFSISETHHRVKNSLQLVSSLLTLEFRKNGTAALISSRRILSQIRALALLHDLLTDVSKDGRDISSIRLQIFLSELLQLVSKSGSLENYTLGEVNMMLSPRQASSLAIVMTEILFTTADEMSSEVELSESEDGALIRIKIIPESSVNTAYHQVLCSELRSNQLTSLLLRTDFDTLLEIQQKEDGALLLEFQIKASLPQEPVLGAFQ